MMKSIITLWWNSKIWQFKRRLSLTRGNDSCNKRHNWIVTFRLSVQRHH